MARKRKKKSARPKLNPNQNQVVQAAYKLGQMDMAEKIYKEIREGTPN